MSKHEHEHKRHFKDIDFEKEWSEDDWRRFFDAQDRLLQEIDEEARSSPVRHKRRAAIEDVFKRLGMEIPDGPSVPPSHELTDDVLLSPSFSHNLRRLPEDGSPVEALPLHELAVSFAQKVLWLAEYRYHGLVHNTYKSARHQATQKNFLLLQERVAKIASFIELGHELGYTGDRINGNIVRCLTALEHADVCLGHVSRLSPAILRPGDAHSLFRWAFRIRNDLINWIHQLRGAARS